MQGGGRRSAMNVKYELGLEADQETWMKMKQSWKPLGHGIGIMGMQRQCACWGRLSRSKFWLEWNVWQRGSVERKQKRPGQFREEVWLGWLRCCLITRDLFLPCTPSASSKLFLSRHSRLAGIPSVSVWNQFVMQGSWLNHRQENTNIRLFHSTVAQRKKKKLTREG